MSSSQKLSLAGKVAIVTGASRGIGAGIALKLAQEGAKVLLTYTASSSETKVNELAAKIKAFSNGSDAAIVRASLSDPSTLQSTISNIVQTTLTTFNTKTIDILVNNAGSGAPTLMTQVKPEEYDWTFELNLKAPFFLTQAVHAHLPPNGGGRIINIGSVGGRSGAPTLSVYCATKAALEGLTRSWASEFGPEGHTVNCVAPSATKSELIEKLPTEWVEKEARETPLRRIGEPEDIAEVVAFLASEGGRWITGQTISASGGFKMY